MAGGGKEYHGERHLTQTVREHTRGAWHPAGDRVQLRGAVKRANFDTAELVRVKFSDNTQALLFEHELGQELNAGDLPKP
jgi:hypothetical protein